MPTNLPRYLLSRWSLGCTLASGIAQAKGQLVCECVCVCVRMCESSTDGTASEPIFRQAPLLTLTSTSASGLFLQKCTFRWFPQTTWSSSDRRVPAVKALLVVDDQEVRMERHGIFRPTPVCALASLPLGSSSCMPLFVLLPWQTFCTDLLERGTRGAPTHLTPQDWHR